MIKNIPDEIKKLFLKDGIKKNLRIHFPNGEREDIINENIVEESLSWTESICSQSNFSFGLSESPQISFDCVGIENIQNCTIECSIEIDITSLSFDIKQKYGKSSNDLKYIFYRIKLGTFVVNSCPKSGDDIIKRKVNGFTNEINLNTLMTRGIMNNQIEFFKRKEYEEADYKSYDYCIDMLKYTLANTTTKYNSLPIKNDAILYHDNDIEQNIAPYGPNSSYTFYSWRFLSGDEPSVYVDLGYKLYYFRTYSSTYEKTNYFKNLYSFENVWGGEEYNNVVDNILNNIDPILGEWYDKYWNNWFGYYTGDNVGLFTKSFFKSNMKNAIRSALAGPMLNVSEIGSTNDGLRSNTLSGGKNKITDGKTSICYPEYRISKNSDILTGSVTGIQSILLPYKIRIACKSAPSNQSFSDYKIYDVVDKNKVNLYTIDTDAYISTYIRNANPSVILNDNDYLEASLELNGVLGRYDRDGALEILSLDNAWGLYPSEDLYPNDVAEKENKWEQDPSETSFGFAIVSSTYEWHSNSSGIVNKTFISSWKINVDNETEYNMTYTLTNKSYDDKLYIEVNGDMLLDGVSLTGIGESLSFSLKEGDNTLRVKYEKGEESGLDDWASITLDPIIINDPDSILYPQDPSGGVIGSLSDYITITYDDNPTKRYDRISVSYENPSGQTISTHLQLIDSKSNEPSSKDETNITEYVENYNPDDYQTYSLGWNKIIQDYTFTEDQIKKILLKVGTQLKKIQYTPAEIELIGQPWIQVGDVICVKTKDDTIRTIVLRRTMNGIDFLRDSFEAKG